jgi:hypothetical protein
MDTLIIPDVVPVVLQHLDIADLISYSKANKSCNEWAEEAWKQKVKNEVSLPVFRKYIEKVENGEKWVSIYIQHKNLCLQSRLKYLMKVFNCHDAEMVYNNRIFYRQKWLMVIFETLASHWWIVINHYKWNKFKLVTKNKLERFRDSIIDEEKKIWNKFKWMYDDLYDCC